jgi:integrase
LGYQNLVLDKATGKWSEPKRGAKYLVARSALLANGKSKREWECFSSFAEAKAYRNRIKPTRPIAQTESIKTGGITLAQLIEDYKANYLPNLQITTQVRYKSYLKHFDFLKDLAVEAIEPTDIDRWIVHIKKPEYLMGHHSTRCDYEHEYSVLKGILTYYATRKNRNYKLPFIKDHHAMLRVKEKITLKKDLSVEQFRQFMTELQKDVVGTKYEVIFYVAIMQYLIYGRVQDAAALQFESFDFTANKIRVNKKVQWSRSKEIEDRVVDGSKKNGGKEIEMPLQAAQLFREWAIKSGVRSGLLFQFESKVIPYRLIEYRYTKALRKAKLPFSATHILRHASLTEYYEACKDLKSTAKVAGHDDLKSTDKYTKVRDATLVKNQRDMDEKLSSLVSLQSVSTPRVR